MKPFRGASALICVKCGGRPHDIEHQRQPVEQLRTTCRTCNYVDKFLPLDAAKMPLTDGPHTKQADA